MYIDLSIWIDCIHLDNFCSGMIQGWVSFLNGQKLDIRVEGDIDTPYKGHSIQSYHCANMLHEDSLEPYQGKCDEALQCLPRFFKGKKSECFVLGRWFRFRAVDESGQTEIAFSLSAGIELESRGKLQEGDFP